MCIIVYHSSGHSYGVATLSRIDKMIGLFCKRALYKRRYSAKETCHFIDPTDRSHPIVQVAICIPMFVSLTQVSNMYKNVHIFFCVFLACENPVVCIYIKK